MLFFLGSLMKWTSPYFAGAYLEPCLTTHCSAFRWICFTVLQFRCAISPTARVNTLSMYPTPSVSCVLRAWIRSPQGPGSALVVAKATDRSATRKRFGQMRSKCLSQGYRTWIAERTNWVLGSCVSVLGALWLPGPVKMILKPTLRLMG